MGDFCGVYLDAQRALGRTLLEAGVGMVMSRSYSVALS